MNQQSNCILCPRRCYVDRTIHMGKCKVNWTLKVARAALHEWEEPCISGMNGSGAVFFVGCNLGCVYCQNKNIAAGNGGVEITIEQLADVFLNLQEKGAHNINLVTAGHYVNAVVPALEYAKAEGLSIPIVYNTSAYELPEVIRQLDGLIDIWMPDLKYIDRQTSARYSNAADYFETAVKAIECMFGQTGSPVFDESGMLKRGLLVRHLVLPGHVREAKRILKYLYESYGDEVYISIMSQYTPQKDVKFVERYPELARRITKREYNSVVDYAIELGITNAFIQERSVAKESFIPAFDGSGIIEKEG